MIFEHTLANSSIHKQNTCHIVYRQVSQRVSSRGPASQGIAPLLIGLPRQLPLVCKRVSGGERRAVSVANDHLCEHTSMEKDFEAQGKSVIITFHMRAYLLFDFGARQAYPTEQQAVFI